MLKRCYFYLAVCISIATLPASAFAETAADPLATDTKNARWTPTANDDGFYIDLPATNYRQLIGLLRTSLAALTQREEAITRYIDENRLDTKDALITAILPGGLLYAAVRKANLEQAQAELDDISEDRDELSRDLLAMQAEARELIVAHLESE